MRIRLKEREPGQRRWATLLDEQFSPDGSIAARAVKLNESSELALLLYPAEPLAFQARVRVGDVLVASTLEQDRPDFLLRMPVESDESSPDYFACSGRLLRDWVGQTELTIEVGEDDTWRPVLKAPLAVTAGKMEQEAFEALCAEIADHSADVLLDVYGKTFIGLEPERRPGETGPVAALQRVRVAIEQTAVSLRAIAHQPAYRMKSRRVREPALAEQSVSALTLEETCVDPTLAVATITGVRFREHVREVAVPSFDLAENRMIAGFLAFLGLQLGDLRARLMRDLHMHEERREYRHRRVEGGGKTWWESEDLPRIAELQRLLDTLATMERDLTQLRRFPFLPPSAPLRDVPVSTPLLRSHKAYSGAYKVIVAHFQAYRVRLDDAHLLTRAKSLPVLYEWWCVLEVLRVLQGCLRLGESDGRERGSPFRRLIQERDRFVVEFAADQAVDFEDERGRLIRLRYVPSYRPLHDSEGLSYGLLGSENERTPDIAVEIFNADDPTRQAPDLIVVLDAKYSSEPHLVKLEEVKRKYGKIGVFNSGEVLSRQVWALAPSRPQTAPPNAPEWGAFCTVDNHGFWSEQFDMRSTVAGVIQCKPQMLGGRSPLESLLRLIFRRSGVQVRG